MLKTIKSIDKDEALTILSKLIEYELPSPFENKIVDSTIFDYKKNIMEEIVKTNNLKEIADDSIDLKSLYLDKISETITELTTKKRDNSLIKSRMGQEGILSTKLYKSVFQSDFNVSIAKFGIRKSHIEDILLKPDIVENFRIGNEVNYSLFLKNIENNNDISQLLVIVQRQNDALIIHNAWRYFSHEIATSGIDILRRFVEQYGFNIDLYGEIRKLFIDYIIKLDDTKDTQIKFKVINNGSKDFTSTVTYKTDLINKIIKIAYLFSIDNKKYLSDLEVFLKRKIT